MHNPDDSVMLLMNGRPRPSVAGIEGALDLRNVDAAAFSEIRTNGRAATLRLYHLTTVNLQGVEALHTVTDLSLHWAPKITSVAPVFAMSWLRRLEIVDFPRLTDLHGVEQLTHLDEFRAAGGVWKPLRIDTIKPLSRLRNLSRLSLQHIRLEDDDITPLAALSNLQSLVLSNEFEREQVAYLAKHLNGGLEEPLAAYSETSRACKRCGEPAFMFTGRGMPFLCRVCDATRFQRLEREFADLVAGV